MAASTEPPPEGTPERAVYDKLAAHLPAGHDLWWWPGGPFDLDYRFVLRRSGSATAIVIAVDIFEAASFNLHDVARHHMRAALAFLDPNSAD